MKNERTRRLNNNNFTGGPIVYLMSRDQRIDDNWALIFALQESKKMNANFRVVFCLKNGYLGANRNIYSFMIKGLRQIELKLAENGVSFSVVLEESELFAYLENIKPGMIVFDFSPLREAVALRTKIAKAVNCAVFEVDAHNIIPVWITSQKREWAAYTIRPKIHSLLSKHLTSFPKFTKINAPTPTSVDWDKVNSFLNLRDSNDRFKWIKSGEKEAQLCLDHFISSSLNNYDANRNNPTVSGQSNLSPYLHFGQISAQSVANKALANTKSGLKSGFLEELIVRRELAENFCFYEKEYDNPACFPNWAKETLEKHKKDKRLHRYTLSDLESAATHDPSWNAAQVEMMTRGKMHGYMRMYWAKKILEWTKDAEEAMRFAVFLNDKYELDGRDPNGYAGIAWSIGGVHDRPWFEREIFGKVRYMSYSGLVKKFDVQKYIDSQKK